MKFTELNLPASLQNSIAKIGFSDATPIQEKTIPLALEGKDIIGSAQTGTGKTGAFLIPILAKLIQNPQAKALIMAPTRELAEQVQKVAFELSGPGTNVRSAILIGGVSFVPQFRMLRYNPQLIVATPGRLLDHCQNAPGLLRNVKYLVLDEADRMLDMGFMPQIQEVMKMLSTDRQTLLFSATLSRSIRALAGSILKDPVQVETSPQIIAAPQIEQKSVEVHQQKKNEALVNILTSFQGSVLVFAKTQIRTEKVSSHLNSLGFRSDSIHGGKSQAKRKSALDLFRKKHVQILVATDVAARGLDIDHVEQVINFDLPMDPEDYVHRIGRTGRAGRSGLATSLVSADERRMWSSIQRLLKIGNDTEKYASEERRRPTARPFGGNGFGQGRGEGGRSPRYENRGESRRDFRRDSPRGDKPEYKREFLSKDSPDFVKPDFVRKDDRGGERRDFAPRREDRRDFAPRRDDRGGERRDDRRSSPRPFGGGGKSFGRRDSRDGGRDSGGGRSFDRRESEVSFKELPAIDSVSFFDYLDTSEKSEKQMVAPRKKSGVKRPFKDHKKGSGNRDFAPRGQRPRP